MERFIHTVPFSTLLLPVAFVAWNKLSEADRLNIGRFTHITAPAFPRSRRLPVQRGRLGSEPWRSGSCTVAGGAGLCLLGAAGLRTGSQGADDGCLFMLTTIVIMRSCF
ncbi:hypothetical protein HPP92_029001 [Vanilla planifolia]|uniref:Uncharacterized protein n=1 Tax=Vanilla planifolia TaxID=51239 RepID=A0A835P728_VANPL|nr:hypothetical protein HPP92_029001 [Vanilla planifolia]KAG0446123.1 hypothetical protein HPP92_028989 [Vanilla planifolia]